MNEQPHSPRQAASTTGVRELLPPHLGLPASSLACLLWIQPPPQPGPLLNLLQCPGQSPRETRTQTQMTRVPRLRNRDLCHKESAAET